MNVQPVRVRATCRDADCRFTGQDMFLDIGVINDHAAAIGFPLRYVQKKGPIIRLIDARTRKETYLRTNPADEDLMEEIRVAAEMRGGAAYAQGTLHWTKWRASPTSVYG